MTTSESILEEAQRITHGDRNVDYGHPLDDYLKTAAFWTTALRGAGLLKDGAEVSPELAALMMCLVKISRQINAPKRDNAVDLAGYAWVAHECVEERARRLPPAPIANMAIIDLRDALLSIGAETID